jgi:hypothetical protein
MKYITYKHEPTKENPETLGWFLDVEAHEFPKDKVTGYVFFQIEIEGTARELGNRRYPLQRELMNCEVKGKLHPTDGAKFLLSWGQSYFEARVADIDHILMFVNNEGKREGFTIEMKVFKGKAK